MNSKGYEENLYTPGCIRTNSGIYVNILDPKPEQFAIEDIAHSLSRIQRWGGHTNFEWSVAQHSIECCLIARNTDRFAALMHDAAEAYLGDMLSPIKKGDTHYQMLEHKFLYYLSQKFSFQYPFTEEIHIVDKIMLEWEWKNLMLGEINPNADKERVKRKFLELFHTYSPQK